MPTGTPTYAAGTRECIICNVDAKSHHKSMVFKLLNFLKVIMQEVGILVNCITYLFCFDCLDSEQINKMRHK